MHTIDFYETCEGALEDAEVSDMRLLAVGAMAAVAMSVAGQGAKNFEIQNQFGDEATWVEAYLEKAHRELVRLMDQRSVEAPRGITVQLSKDIGSSGVSGFATPTMIGFASAQWPRDRFRVWILTHELVNLFVAHYAGAGGFPPDWWANGRSPFPVYLAALVTNKLGEKETAQWLDKLDRDRSDQNFIWALHDKHGFAVFAKCFKLLRSDGIDLGKIGEPWPAPDERRAAWTLTYLSEAAGENLAALAAHHRIGQEPRDWKDRHPELAFKPYAIGAEQIDELRAIRKHLFAATAKGEAVEALRDYFRRGATWRGRSAGTAGGSAPMDFVVESDFGAESEWTRAFLAKASSAFVRALGTPTPTLPARVKVVLRRVAAVAGVGGGATASSIDLISDQWPEEQFRHWILATEFVRFVSHHVGGKIPDDWWGHGDKPFATFTACCLLEGVGLSKEAAWVRDMHRAKPGHEVFWRLHEAHGFELFARFFDLIREDGIDFSQLEAPNDAELLRRRCRLLWAYLSIAADKNLAPLLADAGACAAKDVISGVEVDSAMRKRARLFVERKGSDSERTSFRRGSID